ncbi:MAG: hypothetical protein QNJ38_03000 [Prochloraceae cyanobacterium]|nr:hypothetical protein [Prochloraceae cyanobacterium]
MINENNKKMLGQIHQLLEIDFQSSTIIAQIVSQTPGRLRLRIAKEYRQQQQIDLITQMLQERLQIDRLGTNLQTGSITILYCKERLDFPQISTILAELGVILPDRISEAKNNDGRSRAAAEVIGSFSQLDRKVKLATDEAIDLRFLVPLSFGVLALRQLLNKGLLIEAIPWYVLAWYAFDSFIKLHYSNDNQPLTTNK